MNSVHEELSHLARLGVICFEEDGQRKRPVGWFDELLIGLPFDPESGDTASASS